MLHCLSGISLSWSPHMDRPVFLWIVISVKTGFFFFFFLKNKTTVSLVITFCIHLTERAVHRCWWSIQRREVFTARLTCLWRRPSYSKCYYSMILKAYSSYSWITCVCTWCPCSHVFITFGLIFPSRFLCLKNKNGASVVFSTYTEKHPSIEKGPPFVQPLLNFIWFLLLAVDG